jgi:hypothetical protein
MQQLCSILYGPPSLDWKKRKLGELHTCIKHKCLDLLFLYRKFPSSLKGRSLKVFTLRLAASRMMGRALKVAFALMCPIVEFKRVRYLREHSLRPPIPGGQRSQIQERAVTKRVRHQVE